MVCHFLLQWTTFCQTSPPWPAHLGRPHMAWLSFIELDKAVVHVIRLSSFLWLWFQCVCLLMPLATPTILLEFLLPWKWGISSRLLQQSAATAPYLGQGVSPHSHPSWPWIWNISSRPSCAHAATAPWTWDCIVWKNILDFWPKFSFISFFFFSYVNHHGNITINLSAINFCGNFKNSAFLFVSCFSQ